LPETWSHGDPIDIIGDADGKRYADALKIIAKDKNIDSIVTIFVPTGIRSPERVADVIVNTVRKEKIKNMVTCWVGEEMVSKARPLFHSSDILTFDTPQDAITALSLYADYCQSLRKK